MAVDDVVISAAPLSSIDAVTLYRILALRVDVFVVEQECRYRELDGRDLESDTRIVWASRGDSVVATLRVLSEADGTARIGRVATAVPARGGGLAAQLMQRALELTGERTVDLDAQSYLVEWYRRFGFEVSGPEFLDDGILHTPMRRVPPH